MSSVSPSCLFVVVVDQRLIRSFCFPCFWSSVAFSFSFPFLFLWALCFPPFSFATPPFHKLCSKSFFPFLFFCFCFFFAFKECNDPLIDSSNQSTSKHKQQRKEEQTTNKQQTNNKQQQRALKQTLNRQKTEKGATQRRAVQEVRWQERERERIDPPCL